MRDTTVNLAETISKREQQAQLGQFMTPEVIADFMASWLSVSSGTSAHVLDAGAGRGALSKALAKAWKTQGISLEDLNLSLFEKDQSLFPELKEQVTGLGFAQVYLYEDDYILRSAEEDLAGDYTHAILNPPYKKISSKSPHRLALRRRGIETGNLYSAFVALALQQLRREGQLVAIIPRSFCNGPYFKPFRQQILSCAALTHIHLFDSRTHAFQSDGVLQENIIIRLVKAMEQEDVLVSLSEEVDFQNRRERSYAFSQIVHPDDPDSFIRIPTEAPQKTLSSGKHDARVGLDDIQAQVSTGPVVGFRLRKFLREESGEGAVPLVYPAHLRHGRTRWPLSSGDKANAILVSPETRKWLMPSGCYCLVRRFSSKEERHRIVASVVEESDFDGSDLLGLDNKLNMFHFKKRGLDVEFAYGLAAYLNTDLVDNEFRVFSGHTQVNATDLRKMRYPKRSLLEKLGRKIKSGEVISQEKVYSILEI